MYGKGYEKHYQQIAGVEFRETFEGIEVGNNKSTLFVICNHPVAHGVTNEYFERIGQLIADAKI